jgi:hypothetical protein
LGESIEKDLIEKMAEVIKGDLEKLPGQVQSFLQTDLAEAERASAMLVEIASQLRGQSHLLCLRLERMAYVARQSKYDNKEVSIVSADQEGI